MKTYDESGKELKPLYPCPVCKKEYKTEAGFKKHLDLHFEQNQAGTMVQIFKVNSTPPKAIVDAMCVDALSEIYKTFAVTFSGGTKKLSMVQSFKAGMKIASDHLDLVKECLEPVQSATLAIKHRVIKDIMPIWCTLTATLLESLDGVDDENEMTDAAKTMMALIGDFHVILHEDTPQSKRLMIAKEWHEAFNDAVPTA